VGDLSNFTWKIYTTPDAYRIQECRYPAPPGRIPVSALICYEKGEYKDYRPLAGHESLYRALAAVPPTPEGILEFARQYGRLGEGVEEHFVRPEGSYGPAEPLREWRKTIEWLKELIRLWGLVQKKDSAQLSKVIRWQHKSAVHYRATEEFVRQLRGPGDSEPSLDFQCLRDPGVTIASVDYDPSLLTAFAAGDVLDPAQCFIVRIISDALKETVQPVLRWDKNRRKVLLRYFPCSLLGAIYLQFSTAILGGRETRMCPVCQKYFEVTAVASRNDRLTCSDSCRVRAYRDRQAKARELHSKKWSIKRIAKEIGSDVSTVKKWISSMKG
jgi:hypothetical protein